MNKDNESALDARYRFGHGGPSMCLLFQPGAADRFAVQNRPAGDDAEGGPPARANAQIAAAR